MRVEPTTLTRLGAWGQVATVGLAAVCLLSGVDAGLAAAFFGYHFVTLLGVVGVYQAETELPVYGFAYFVFPGMVPAYYFGNQ
jgi:hypothetical protein